jgi:hypothetical protein
MEAPIYCWNFASSTNMLRNTNIIANFKIRDFFFCLQHLYI